MAEVRYPDSIEVRYEYDPEISFVRVPPLLLHNFVENIVKYAVKQGQITHISLLGQYIDGIVTFMIMDDGAGMSEEEVKNLDKRMRNGNIDGETYRICEFLKKAQVFYGETRIFNQCGCWDGNLCDDTVPL